MSYCANLQPPMLISLITGSLEQIQLKTYNADFDLCVNNYKHCRYACGFGLQASFFYFFPRLSFMSELITSVSRQTTGPQR